MKIISCREKAVVGEDALPKKTAVALGFFDGVHIGHATLISDIVKSGYAPVVYTFASHPAEILFSDDDVEYITDNEEKTEILASLGAEYVIFDDFAAIKDMSCEDFVSDVLCKRLHCAYAVCGENYRFGKGGEGDGNELARLISQSGAKCNILPPVTSDGAQVSSTRIRELICAGDVEEAAKLLGRPYSFSSVVTGGNRLGRTIGFPTVNQYIKKGAVIPKRGVYAVLCDVSGTALRGVCNIGIKPTVGGTELLAETHIIGYSGNLYGKSVRISLLCRLRDEKKYSSVDELARAIADDIEKAEKYSQTNCEMT